MITHRIIYTTLKNRLLALLLLCSLTATAQYHYTIDQSVPVEISGRRLTMPWSGGLNSAQVNTMDINGDNQPDLVIYDKGLNKISTFIKTGNAYQYAPEYESLFPSLIHSFLLLRDYNGDGKKDIFTFNSDENGISAFKNVTLPGGNLSWQLYNYTTRNLTSPQILRYINKTTGKPSVNILPGSDDIPNIIDMDGDGDLDILNMRFVNPMEAEYQENISPYRDSLLFDRQSRWGDWEDCSCGIMAFGNNCSGGRAGRAEHTGGKALLTLDFDNDGDQDLLYTEEQCGRLYYLPNQGTASVPLMNSVSNFPTVNPVALVSYPSPFLEDVDFDGVPDLIISPNLNGRTSFSTTFDQSLWFYKNTGTAQLPNFTFVKRNFLQENMIDVGDNAVPAFFDYDGDGDLDLFIGTNTSSQDYTGRLIVYENTGTNTAPAFRLVTNDFAFLSFFQAYNIRPQFADVNGDGITDLAFTATRFTNGVTALYFLPGVSGGRISPNFSDIASTEFFLSNTENILLTDVNRDGALDILLGKNTGALHYYQNTGRAGSLNFTLRGSSFLNLGVSTSRQNLSLAVGDLDADGKEELITGDQRGILTVYPDFRSTNPVPQGVTNLIYNSISNNYASKNLGGRVWPTIANIFNENKPAILVGNTAGGMYLLKTDGGSALASDPIISLWPNPLTKGQDLTIKADRPISVQIFSQLGQKMSEPIAISAYEEYPIALRNLSAGMYIARISVDNKSVRKTFIVVD
jgi:FG-GAP-like repeat/Secretion system C-terminal sorting domain